MSSSFTSMIPRYCGSSRNNMRGQSDDQLNRKRKVQAVDRKVISAHENVPVHVPHKLLQTFYLMMYDALQNYSREWIFTQDRFLRNIIAHLQIGQLKTARLVSKKWNVIIFPLLLEKTCIAFTGENAICSYASNEFSEFIRATPRQGFSWKIICALYKTNVEKGIPLPYVIPWSFMRIRNATKYELTPWIHHSHLTNITSLELQKIDLSSKQLYIYLRQFTNLRRFRDVSLNYICSPELRSSDTDDFTKNNNSLRKNAQTGSYREYNRRNEEDIFLKCPRIKQPLTHVEIRRSQLEDIILHLKVLQLLSCQELVSLKLIAADTFISSDFVDKRHRTQDIKVDLYKNLTEVLKNNRETLKILKLAFRHTSMEDWFDLSASHFEDQMANRYKPELAQFFAYVNHFGWKSFNMMALTDFSLEIENKRNITDEEVKNFTLFLSSLKKLKTLKLSHLLFSSENHQYILKVIKKFQDAVPNDCTCNFEAMYKDEALNIPPNLTDKLSNYLSAVVICSEQPILTKFSCGILLNNINNNTDENARQNFPNVKYFWYGDNIHGGFDLKRFRIRELVQDFPNLTTFIVRDALHDSLHCSPDIKRWNIIDDFNMQLILKNLHHLKYIAIFGNLTYLTDSGVTGISLECLERMYATKDYTVCPSDIIGTSFSSLKNLQVCCLAYLGSKITDVSLQHGFNNLKNLKILELGGAIQITQMALDLAKIILPQTSVVLKSPI